MTDDKHTSEPPSLDEFATRLDAARSARRGARGEERDGSNSSAAGLMGVGLRVATELVVALAVGVGLGYGLDVVADTSPFGVLGGFGLGLAAGFNNVRRAMTEIAPSASADEADDPDGN